MISVFINIGEGFKDEKLNIFRRALEARMTVKCFDFAIEKIEEINDLDWAGPIFYFETDICRKNKNYDKAFINVINKITPCPSAVYIMPFYSLDIVKAIAQRWPQCDIYHFEYDKMKPAIKIN